MRRNLDPHNVWLWLSICQFTCLWILLWNVHNYLQKIRLLPKKKKNLWIAHIKDVRSFARWHIDRFATWHSIGWCSRRKYPIQQFQLLSLVLIGWTPKSENMKTVDVNFYNPYINACLKKKTQGLLLNAFVLLLSLTQSIFSPCTCLSSSSVFFALSLHLVCLCCVD